MVGGYLLVTKLSVALVKWYELCMILVIPMYNKDKCSVYA